MIGYFQSIPKELDEAALIDGAGHYADAVQDFHSGGVARHHRRDDLRLHGVVGRLRLSDGVPLLRPTSRCSRSAPSTSLIRADVYKWGMLMAGALLAARRRSSSTRS